MTISFRKASVAEAKPLVGLYSESGSGKTKSALLLALGFTGDMSKVGMIETESGRGEAYANDPQVGGYNVLPIREDFSPKAYGAAIRAAEQANLGALIIDSASHEWEGVGGVLDMAAKNQADGRKGPLVWQQPKIDHQREFMLRLMQTPIPLVIVCMRAKYVMEQVDAEYVRKWKAAGGSGQQPKIGDWARSPSLSPKQSEDILFEMFIHGWIDKEHCFHGTKYTVDTLRTVFKDGEPLTADTGRRLLEWTKGPKAMATRPDLDAAGPSGTPDTPPGQGTGAEPPADPLLNDIAHHVKRKQFDLAYDLARGIENLTLRASTIERINKAKDYVASKGAA